MIDSPINYIVLMSLILIFSSIFITKNKFIKLQINNANNDIDTLDGLRAVLALGVFFHHTIIMYYYLDTSVWTLPTSKFYTLLGHISVILFFMITGFLFWRKILNNPNLDVIKLFKSRIKRIVPLYIFSVLLVFLVIAFLSKFTMHVPFNELIIQLLKWFTFNSFGHPNINNIKDTYIIEGVYWTLYYEWSFYFLLPILAFLLRKSKYLVILLMLIFYFYAEHVFIYFMYGMIAAQMINSNKNHPIFSSNYFRTFATISFIAIFFLSNIGYTKWPGFFSFIFFISVLYGNSIFGLLKLKATKALGLMSYSIYLLHNIILFIIFTSFNKYVLPINNLSDFQLFLLILFTLISVVFISRITYQYIEHKFYFQKRKAV